MIDTRKQITFCTSLPNTSRCSDLDTKQAIDDQVGDVSLLSIIGRVLFQLKSVSVRAVNNEQLKIDETTRRRKRHSSLNTLRLNTTTATLQW